MKPRVVRPVGSAVIAAAALAVAAACCAAPAPDAARAIRGAERLQQDAASGARRNAAELAVLADAYRYNRLAEPPVLEALGTLRSGLERLSDPSFSAQATNMPAALAALAQARAEADAAVRRRRLLEASRAQSEVLQALQSLMALARARLGGLTAARTLAAVADTQKALAADTGRLGAETLGLDPADLSEDLRQDLGSSGGAQGALRDELGAALAEMDAHAVESAAFQPEYAAAVRRAVADLRSADAGGLMRAAADRIAANRLAQAQEIQGRILALLQSALALVNQEFALLQLSGTGAAATAGSGPGGGPVDGAFADPPPFELLMERPPDEYIPGFGPVPMVRPGPGESQRAWQVGLPEKERQVLESAMQERFPEKYAELLRAYYRALAGGEAP